MAQHRLDSLPLEKVAEVAKDAAASVLKDRMADWNGHDLEIGLFPDGGIVGGRIFCKNFKRLEANELFETAEKINAKLSRSIVGLDVEVRLVDRIITMGGKIGPDIVFDRFGR